MNELSEDKREYYLREARKVRAKLFKQFETKSLEGKNNDKIDDKKIEVENKLTVEKYLNTFPKTNFEKYNSIENLRISLDKYQNQIETLAKITMNINRSHLENTLKNDNRFIKSPEINKINDLKAELYIKSDKIDNLEKYNKILENKINFLEEENMLIKENLFELKNALFNKKEESEMLLLNLRQTIENLLNKKLDQSIKTTEHYQND
ncbi:hypothetical protein MHBO_001241 [Bonamia ostreae]|uniref:Uncharacterized protein n=1 Tax=Bonamia ostreae TaxID=126728 RepID=A0ABV2AJ53_9EUKA